MTFLEDYLREQAETKAKFTDPVKLKALKKDIAERLSVLQLEELSIYFDGQGDEGQIEYMEPELDDDIQHDFFETLVYEMLEVYHGGWENNEGAYGTITFRPNEIDYDFNIRTTSSDFDGFQL